MAYSIEIEASIRCLFYEFCKITQRVSDGKWWWQKEDMFFIVFTCAVDVDCLMHILLVGALIIYVNVIIYLSEDNSCTLQVGEK